MATKNVYRREDLVITFADTNPVQISENIKRFVTLEAQADLNNADDVFIGGTDPQTRLVANASKSFDNGSLNSIWAKGQVGDIIRVHIEY